MDDLRRRTYPVDPVSAITFCAPKELVDRNDIFVCVEYRPAQRPIDGGACEVRCQVWCRYKDATWATAVCEIRIAVDGSAFDASPNDSILNGVLRSPEAVREIQKFAETRH